MKQIGTHVQALQQITVSVVTWNVSQESKVITRHSILDAWLLQVRYHCEQFHSTLTQFIRTFPKPGISS